jgi:VIT1/CCC1 family predicted Fe2+/Mn2+ transporter
MMVEELGLLYDDSNPIFNGLVTFGSFVVFGIVPICPYIYGAIAKAPNHMNLWLTSIIMTVVTLFFLGLGKAGFS